MNMNLKGLLVLCFFMAFSLYSGRSEACCGDGVVAAQGATAAGATVSSTITESTAVLQKWLLQIDRTIQQGFGKMYVEIQRQTAEERTIQQGVIAAQTQLYMERARAEAAVRYEVSPRACFETSGGAAVATASAETTQNVDDLNRQSADRTLFTANTAADVHQMMDNHLQKYCSAQDAALGRCTAAPAAMQNADVRVDTLLTHSSLSADQVAAAQQFRDNLINPLPTQNLPKGLENTSAGKMFIAGQYIEQAGLSVATNSINQSIAIRTPVQGLGSSAMMSTPDISEMGLMEAQVAGRFESPAWYTMIAGMSQDNLLREMNKQMALKLWMDLKAFKQQERQEAALATILALDVRRDSAESLPKARAAALRSSQ